MTSPFIPARGGGGGAGRSAPSAGSEGGGHRVDGSGLGAAGGCCSAGCAAALSSATVGPLQDAEGARTSAPRSAAQRHVEQRRCTY